MENKDLSEVLAIIYDPVRGNMLTTRGVLHGMGFRRIDGITSFSALERRLKDVEVSVLFIEASEESKKIIDMVQAIRMGETKANPFLPIIATLWTGNGEAVAGLMNSGCDDVLLRPFSVVKVKERVKAIIDNRKKFVVTSDYVGPDRGDPSSGRGNVEPFEVPNPLKEVANGIHGDPVKQVEQVENAKKRVNKERLAKLARRIAMAAEVTIQAKQAANEETGFVTDLLETSAELVKTARRMGQDEIQDIAMVLENVVAKTAVGHNRAENAQLARQLALSIFVAYAADEGDDFKKDLDKTLEMVRSRLEKAKAREKRRRDLAKSMDFSGFDDNTSYKPDNAKTPPKNINDNSNEDDGQYVLSKYNLLK